MMAKPAGWLGRGTRSGTEPSFPLSRPQRRRNSMPRSSDWLRMDTLGSLGPGARCKSRKDSTTLGKSHHERPKRAEPGHVDRPTTAQSRNLASGMTVRASRREITGHSHIRVRNMQITKIPRVPQLGSPKSSTNMMWKQSLHKDLV